MGLKDDIQSAIDDVVSEPWKETSPADVPESDEVALKNGAARVDATYLYADLANSTALAQSVAPEIVARVMRLYLNVAVRVLRHKEAAIRSFDGDRVMGIFMGNSKNTNAARAAMGINYYVSQVLRERAESEWPELGSAGWTFEHGIGIDTGEALIVRGGVRNNNDLVSVGSAPNVAAKLSAIRDFDPIHITKRSHDRVAADVRVKEEDGRNRFRVCGKKTLGGTVLDVYSSNWWWTPW